MQCRKLGGPEVGKIFGGKWTRFVSESRGENQGMKESQRWPSGANPVSAEDENLCLCGVPSQVLASHDDCDALACYTRSSNFVLLHKGHKGVARWPLTVPGGWTGGVWRRDRRCALSRGETAQATIYALRR